MDFDDDLPTLDPLMDDSELEEEDTSQHPLTYCQEDNSVLIERIQTVLMQCQPYPGDGKLVDPSFKMGNPCFFIECQDQGFFCIYDCNGIPSPLVSGLLKSVP